MIQTVARVVYGPFHNGRWRYSAGSVEVCCDADGCGATVAPAGLEHNGGAIESIYLPDGAQGWRLGAQDFCPAHAPVDEVVGDAD